MGAASGAFVEVDASSLGLGVEEASAPASFSVD
jgi:hypothetical protein